MKSVRRFAIYVPLLIAALPVVAAVYLGVLSPYKFAIGVLLALAAGVVTSQLMSGLQRPLLLITTTEAHLSEAQTLATMWRTKLTEGVRVVVVDGDDVGIPGWVRYQIRKPSSAARHSLLLVDLDSSFQAALHDHRYDALRVAVQDGRVLRLAVNTGAAPLHHRTSTTGKKRKPNKPSGTKAAQEVQYAEALNSPENIKALDGLVLC